MLRKILAVARTEYDNAVRSKAFILGVIMMPVLMGGGLVTQKFLEDRVDVDDRRIAVVDDTGALYEVLAARAAERNEQEIFVYEDGVKGRQNKSRFLFEPYQPTDDERADLVLSARVKEGELFAFLLIGADASATEPAAESAIAYHTQTPTYRDLPRWIEYVLNEEIQSQRFADAQLDRDLIDRLRRQIDVRQLGLVSVASDGSVDEAEEKNRAEIFVPLGAMGLLFMLVMMSAPALLNQVLEEKMQKISEVLISAVTPFELMMGKLVAQVFVSMTLSVLYVGAIYYALNHFGVAHMVPTSIYFWFILFQLIALFMFGAVFSALGAACSELRDAQSLMMPAMLIVMIPFFCLGPIINSPTSGFCRALSFFPPATPTVMLLRIGLSPPPPLWEVGLSLVLCIGFTILCVMASAKIFRIGILAQGTAPSMRNLVQWLFSK